MLHFFPEMRGSFSNKSDIVNYVSLLTELKNDFRRVTGVLPVTDTDSLEKRLAELNTVCERNLGSLNDHLKKIKQTNSALFKKAEFLSPEIKTALGLMQECKSEKEKIFNAYSRLLESTEEKIAAALAAKNPASDIQLKRLISIRDEIRRIEANDILRWHEEVLSTLDGMSEESGQQSKIASYAELATFVQYTIFNRSLSGSKTLRIEDWIDTIHEYQKNGHLELSNCIAIALITEPIQGLIQTLPGVNEEYLSQLSSLKEKNRDLYDQLQQRIESYRKEKAKTSGVREEQEPKQMFSALLVLPDNLEGRLKAKVKQAILRHEITASLAPPQPVDENMISEQPVPGIASSSSLSKQTPAAVPPLPSASPLPQAEVPPLPSASPLPSPSPSPVNASAALNKPASVAVNQQKPSQAQRFTQILGEKQPRPDKVGLFKKNKRARLADEDKESEKVMQRADLLLAEIQSNYKQFFDNVDQLTNLAGVANPALDAITARYAELHADVRTADADITATLGLVYKEQDRIRKKNPIDNELIQKLERQVDELSDYREQYRNHATVVLQAAKKSISQFLADHFQLSQEEVLLQLDRAKPGVSPQGRNAVVVASPPQKPSKFKPPDKPRVVLPPVADTNAADAAARINATPVFLPAASIAPAAEPVVAQPLPLPLPQAAVLAPPSAVSASAGLNKLPPVGVKPQKPSLTRRFTRIVAAKQPRPDKVGLFTRNKRERPNKVKPDAKPRVVLAASAADAAAKTSEPVVAPPAVLSRTAVVASAVPTPVVTSTVASPEPVVSAAVPPVGIRKTAMLDAEAQAKAEKTTGYKQWVAEAAVQDHEKKQPADVKPKKVSFIDFHQQALVEHAGFLKTENIQTIKKDLRGWRAGQIRTDEANKSYKPITHKLGGAINVYEDKITAVDPNVESLKAMITAFQSVHGKTTIPKLTVRDEFVRDTLLKVCVELGYKKESLNIAIIGQESKEDEKHESPKSR